MTNIVLRCSLLFFRCKYFIISLFILHLFSIFMKNTSIDVDFFEFKFFLQVSLHQFILTNSISYLTAFLNYIFPCFDFKPFNFMKVLGQMLESKMKNTQLMHLTVLWVYTINYQLELCLGIQSMKNFKSSKL